MSFDEPDNIARAHWAESSLEFFAELNYADELAEEAESDDTVEVSP